MFKQITFALATSALLFGCSSTSENTDDASSQDAIAPTTDEIEAMTIELATPGEYHNKLNPLVGNFGAQTTYWATPDSSPQTSEGKTKSRWVLDGRFVLTNFRGQMFNRPYEGISFMGYDNASENFVATWADTAGTNLYPISTGTCNTNGSVITMTRTMEDPITSTYMNTREVTTIFSNDEHKFEMFVTPTNGEEFKTMEIFYTRH